jgi:GNAT superfamily N-acetyltransferase
MTIPFKSRALHNRRVTWREPVQVRSPSLSDSASLSELLEQLGYPSTEEQVQQRLSSLDASTGQRVLIADLWLGNQAVVAGFLALQFGVFFHSDLRHAQLTALVTDRRYRHRGVARALVAEAQSLARREHCVLLHLRSNRSRDDAHGFFRAMGFDETHLTFEKKL